MQCICAIFILIHSFVVVEKEKRKSLNAYT